MSTAFDVRHLKCLKGTIGGDTARGAVPASASKIHAVAVVPEHGEGPIGRRRCGGFHDASVSVGRGRLADDGVVRGPEDIMAVNALGTLHVLLAGDHSSSDNEAALQARLIGLT
jgi:hypothetical protein